MDKNFERRVKKAITEIGEIYKKYNLGVTLSVRLPRHAKPPLLTRLALWVLSKHGAIIDTLYTDLKKK